MFCTVNLYKHTSNCFSGQKPFSSNIVLGELGLVELHDKFVVMWSGTAFMLTSIEVESIASELIVKVCCYFTRYRFWMENILIAFSHDVISCRNSPFALTANNWLSVNSKKDSGALKRVI